MNNPQKVTGVVQIHGREYETVALRIQKFRASHSDWTLETEIIERSDEAVVMRAKITDATGRLRATGHSEEYRHTSQINRTSALENAETSAIGRALAALGFGGTEFATANEVQNAMFQQRITPTSGAKDNISPEEREKVDEVVKQVRDWLSKGSIPDAVAVADNAEMSADEAVYFWTNFDSKQRAAMKLEQKAARERALKRDLATQA